MSEKKLTAQFLDLRRKLTVAPIGFVPVLGVLFYIGGGGGGIEAQANANDGFNVSVPKSESQEIVGTKQEAYEQKNDAYMSGFNTDILPEMDLENQTNEVWQEEKADDFDTHSSLLDVYQQHNIQLQERRSEYGSSNTYTENRPQITNDPKPNIATTTIKDEEKDPIIETVSEQNQPIERNRGNLFHDNRGSRRETNNVSSNVKSEILAVIHGNQEIGGSRNRVKLRTTQKGMIGGVVVPQNTIIYANASINGNRLQLSIANMTINNITKSISANVYDVTDGNLGLTLSTGVGAAEDSRLGSEVIRQSGNVIGGAGVVGAVINSAGSALGNIFSRNNENSSIQLISNHQVIIR